MTLQPADQRGIITILMMVINDQDETFQRSIFYSLSSIMPLMDPTLVGLDPTKEMTFCDHDHPHIGMPRLTSLVFDDVVGYRSVAALPLNSLYGQIKYDWMLIRTANHQAINESLSHDDADQ